MTVLVCEDEEIMLTALEFRLRKYGYDVQRAVDGREALAYLSKSLPDIIIADIMMPHVTGLELVTHIREDLKSNIPIIVISALELDEVVLEATKLGADDFITKPFRPVELVLRVRKLLQERGYTEED